MTVQETLGAFVSETDYGDLPAKVVERAKYCLLDYLACALVGSRTLLAEKYYLLGKKMGGAPESTMMGDGCLVPAMWAATTNGTIGHIHELDDSCPGGGHTGTVVIPAALAVGEREGCTGKELLTSIVLGYDVACRVGGSVGPSHRGRGFHSTATFATFGAAAAAGKELGLDAEGLARAFGLASIQATGILEVHKGRSILKPVQVGKASGNGVLSAQFAKAGVPASKTILEEKYLKAFTDGDFDVDKITRSMGEDYAIMKTAVKFHPSCAHTHKAIDAAMALKREHSIEPSGIERVTVRSYSYAAKYMGGPDRYDPESITGAKFSIPYLIALVISNGAVDVGAFTPHYLGDEGLRGLMEKIEVVGDPELDRAGTRPQEVEVSMTDGNRYVHRVDTSRGDPKVLSLKDVAMKYQSIVELALPRREADILRKKILHLEEMEDLSDLRPYLATDRFSRPYLQ